MTPEHLFHSPQPSPNLSPPAPTPLPFAPYLMSHDRARLRSPCFSSSVILERNGWVITDWKRTYIRQPLITGAGLLPNGDSSWRTVSFLVALQLQSLLHGVCHCLGDVAFTPETQTHSRLKIWRTVCLAFWSDFLFSFSFFRTISHQTS